MPPAARSATSATSASSASAERSDDRPGIMWFRRDLRLSDNPALVAATRRHDRVLPVFVLDPALWGPAGANRRWFLVGCLAELHEATGGALVVRHGDPTEVVPALAEEIDAAAVHAAEDFGPYGSRRDAAVAEALAEQGVGWAPLGSPYAVPPETVFTKAGDPYRVFTPFSRAWRAHGWDDPVAKPADISWMTGVQRDPIPGASATADDLPEPGEGAAKRRADAFLDSPVARYREERNLPASDGTSKLSPYLKYGCIHPRQLLARLDDTEDHRAFATELAWRDFYADVLWHWPESARWAFNPAMAGMDLDTGEEADRRFAAWCEGRTGFPIVDAGMRQLLGEGWMHNRVRMITASFLVKDLHIDWTRGARWYMAHLVDGDLASNQHGWQWTAGTGTDAAPYFRIFNPTTQGKRFDPDGDYIRRWVPELVHLDGDVIHEPAAKAQESLFATGSEGAGIDDAYPHPIVDHKAERAEALARYQALRGESD